MFRGREARKEVTRFVNSDGFRQDHLFELCTNERKDIILQQVNQMLFDCGYSEFIVDNFTAENLKFHLVRIKNG